MRLSTATFTTGSVGIYYLGFVFTSVTQSWGNRFFSWYVELTSPISLTVIAFVVSIAPLAVVHKLKFRCKAMAYGFQFLPYMTYGLTVFPIPFLGIGYGAVILHGLLAVGTHVLVFRPNLLVRSAMPIKEGSSGESPISSP